MSTSSPGASAIPIGERRGELPLRDNLRQQRACTKKGTAKIKGKIKATYLSIPLPVHVPITIPPPDEKEPRHSGRAAKRLGDGTKKKRRKIQQIANIVLITGGTSSHTDRRTTSCTTSAITTRSGRGGDQSGFAIKLGYISRSTTSAPDDGVGVGTRPQ